MLGEVKALEPQLKQILYGCVEHVQATKAALYLSESPDVDAAKKIADQLAELLSAKNLFGLAPIRLVDAPQVVAAPNVNADRRIEDRTRSELTPISMRAITAARATMSKRQLSQASG